jgi:L-iditol 2-dehydrogenase
MAMRLGAHRAVNVGRESLMEIARDESDGFGVDVAFECAGAAASAQNCLDALRPLGQYTQIAHFGREVTVNLDRIGFKQLRFSGSVGYTHRTWARVMEILKEGKITLADLVSHRLPLERWREGFDLCANKQAVKVLLSP